MRTRLLRLVASLMACFSAAAGAHAAGFITDFNTGLPPGTKLNNQVGPPGVVDAIGGVGNSGVLKLTSFNTFGSVNAFYVTNLSGGALTNFRATFRLALGG